MWVAKFIFDNGTHEAKLDFLSEALSWVERMSGAFELANFKFSIEIYFEEKSENLELALAS